MTLLLDDHVTASRHGDIIAISTPGSVITLHRFANDVLHLRRFPCSDPDAAPNWTE
jgi:hypothetical protein